MFLEKNLDLKIFKIKLIFLILLLYINKKFSDGKIWYLTLKCDSNKVKRNYHVCHLYILPL